MSLLNKGLMVLVGLLLVAGGITRWQYQRALAQNTELALRLSTEQHLNDSTTARLATTTVARDSLRGLVAAAKDLNGHLVVALRIAIAARDTHVVHDTLPTQLTTDSTRTATFADSTFAGRLEGTVTAPPCCAPLRLEYALHRPAFAPEVGIVRVGSSYVATVVWQGEQVHVVAPFFQPPPKKLSWLGYFVGGYINQDKVVYGRGGLEVRTPLAFLQAGLDTRGEVFTGLSKSW